MEFNRLGMKMSHLIMLNWKNLEGYFIFCLLKLFFYCVGDFLQVFINGGGKIEYRSPNWRKWDPGAREWPWRGIWTFFDIGKRWRRRERWWFLVRWVLFYTRFLLAILFSYCLYCQRHTSHPRVVFELDERVGRLSHWFNRWVPDSTGDDKYRKRYMKDNVEIMRKFLPREQCSPIIL